MNFVWNTNELNASVVSIYETNITLNTTACMHFENVNYVLLGIDYDNHCIGIKPVGSKPSMTESIHRTSFIRYQEVSPMEESQINHLLKNLQI